MSLFEEASLAFEKGAGWLFISATELSRRRCKILHLHGAVPVVLDGLYLDLPATHFRLAQTALRIRDGPATRQLMVTTRC